MAAMRKPRLLRIKGSTMAVAYRNPLSGAPMKFWMTVSAMFSRELAFSKFFFSRMTGIKDCVAVSVATSHVPMMNVARRSQ
jgi:hypothetical protein